MLASMKSKKIKIALLLVGIFALSFIPQTTLAKGESFEWKSGSAKNTLVGKNGFFDTSTGKQKINFRLANIDASAYSGPDKYLNAPASGYAYWISSSSPATDDPAAIQNSAIDPTLAQSCSIVLLLVNSTSNKVMGPGALNDVFCKAWNDSDASYSIANTADSNNGGGDSVDDPELNKAASNGIYSVLSDPLNDLKIKYYQSLGNKAPCDSRGCDDSKWQQMIYECWSSARTSAASTARLTAQAISQGSSVQPYDENSGTKSNFSGCLSGKLGGLATKSDISDILLDVSASDVNKAWDDRTAALEEQRDEQNSPTTAANTTSCTIDAIGWMVCPILNALSGLNDLLYGWIESVLVLNPLQMFNDDGTPTAQYQNWQTIRNIANVLLVIAFLFVIFSQLTSFGISNYGVKKMLPRIIMIAIAINVSYLIMTIMVDAVNIIGVGLHDILDNLAISATMDSLNATNVIGSFVTGTTLTIAGVAIGGSVAVLGSFGLGALALLALPFIVVAVLSLFAAVATLFIRNALVIVLVIISPIAIAAYVLPNTEEWFTKWRKLFISMLMLFPMAAILFAGAKFASYVILTSGQPLGALIALFIMAAPLGALPFLIKSSNSVLAGIGNRLQGMAKSVKNPMQKGLKPYVDRSKERYRSGTTNFMGNRRNPNGKTNLAQRADSRRRTVLGETEGHAKQAEDNYNRARNNPLGEVERDRHGNELGIQTAAAQRRARRAQEALTRSDDAQFGLDTSKVIAEERQTGRIATNPNLRRLSSQQADAQIGIDANKTEEKLRNQQRVRYNAASTTTGESLQSIASRQTVAAEEMKASEGEVLNIIRGSGALDSATQQQKINAQREGEWNENQTADFNEAVAGSEALTEVALGTDAAKVRGGVAQGRTELKIQRQKGVGGRIFSQEMLRQGLEQKVEGVKKRTEQAKQELQTDSNARYLNLAGTEAREALKSSNEQIKIATGAIASAERIQQQEFAEKVETDPTVSERMAGVDPRGEPLVVAQAIETRRKAYDANVSAYTVSLAEAGTPDYNEENPNDPETLFSISKDPNQPQEKREAAGRAIVAKQNIDAIKPYMDYLVTEMDQARAEVSATENLPDDNPQKQAALSRKTAIEALHKSFGDTIDKSAGKPMGVGAADVAKFQTGTYERPAVTESVRARVGNRASQLSPHEIQTLNTVVEKGVSMDGWATMDKSDIGDIYALVHNGLVPAETQQKLWSTIDTALSDRRWYGRMKDRERKLLADLIDTLPAPQDTRSGSPKTRTPIT